MLSARSRTAAILLAVAHVFATGCVLGDIDLADRRCPCVAGWMCDEASDRCVPAIDLDGGEALADADVPRDADIPHDAPPPPPTCDTIPDAIFCDDFERGDLTRWTVIEPAPGGSVSATTLAARTGAQGMRLSAPANASGSRIVAAIDTTDLTELHFGAWVRVSARTAGTLEVFELSSSSDGIVAAQLLPASASYLVRVVGADAGLVDEGRMGRWSVGAWTCVRGRVVRGDAMGRVEILDSGPHQAILANVDTDWGSPYDVFALTLAASEAGSQIDVDDVTWTRTALPCPAGAE